jgi:ABC-type Fe3+-hydroxamate transport system substrate-binding protein
MRWAASTGGTCSVALVSAPRIVSLVPSITELLCDLDLSEQLVGRTGFCIHPWETVKTIPKVGGTKDLKFDKIRALEPTHVIVNVDENRKEDAEALAEFIPNVVVTHPLGPRDNLDLYRQIGREFDREAEAEALCEKFEAALSRVEHRPEQDVLYLIWRDPWMTISPGTYISRTLGLFNWRTQPLDVGSPMGDQCLKVRYPEVDLADFSDVDRVLLSSEPFHFKERHVAEVEELVPGAVVSLIDGEMTSWYGSRAIAGLGYLAEYTK